jgi:hypothetical protein
MDNKIIKAIKYFSFFGYYPTLNEIYTFLQARIGKNSLEKKINKMVKKKILLASKYTPPQYSIVKKISNIKYQISKKKLNNWKFKTYMSLLSLAPQIKLIGLSGSISMMNAGMNDDIDLFIITERNRLFTGRLIALILAQLFGLRRTRGMGNNNNKICLNLFFDEKSMKVPKFKQTEFVGHEVLQMKPIVNKEMTYERFLASNKWVYKIFPNTKQTFNFKFSLPGRKAGIFEEKLRDWLESKLKSFQMKLINKHKTTEIITNTQLWFHPDDFEKKLPYLDKADSI